jgi:UDP-glucose 4-epimerase
MKRILITGVNGFVGRSLAEYLKDMYDIVGLGRAKKTISCASEYISMDIADEKMNHLDIGLVDVIIHAAACMSMADYDDELMRTNVLGTYNIIKLACRSGCKKLIYISSVGVIGLPTEFPITEEWIPRPNTLYHTTKLMGEYLVAGLKSDQCEVVILRIPSPVGPRMPEKTILPIFIGKAMNNQKLSVYGQGTRKQNYVDVRDISKAVEQCMKLDGIAGCYNIAGESAISNRDLAILCLEVTESSGKIVFSGTEDPLEGQEWNIDISKAQNVLGYRPQISLRQSIEDIVQAREK